MLSRVSNRRWQAVLVLSLSIGLLLVKSRAELVSTVRENRLDSVSYSTLSRQRSSKASCGGAEYLLEAV